EAKERTQTALQAESAARQKAEMYRYFLHVVRAHAEWRDGSMERVEPLLDDAPKALRGWEWHYLKRLCQADLLTLRGLRSGIFTVAFSPDGTRLAAAGGDAMVWLWDLRTGEKIRTFAGHGDVIRGVAFSPDGARLASAGADHTVMVWEAATGQRLHTLRGHTGEVWGVAFSPDGSRLASSSLDKTVRVWDASTGQRLHTLAGEAEFFQGVAFSPDGRQVAAAGAAPPLPARDP